MVQWGGEMLLAAVCLGWVAMIVLWDRTYLLLPVDDAYYYLETAVNIACGHGSTFDQINPTNGYHPLWMGVMVLLAELTTSTGLLMRLTLILQVLLVYAGLRVLTRSQGAPLPALPLLAGLVLAHFYPTRVLVNGLEVSLQWLLLCIDLAYLWYLQRRESLPCPRELALLGLLCGLTVLARLDSAFFALPVLLAPLWLPGRAWASCPWGERLKPCIAGLVTFGLVLLPYVAYNIVEYGHAMPISGSIKIGWGTAHASWPIRGAAASACVLLALCFGAMARRAWVDGGPPRALFWLGPLAVFVCLGMAYNLCFLGASVPFLWYRTPHILLLVLSLALWFQHLRSSPKRARYAQVALAGYVALGVATWTQWLHPACAGLAAEKARVGRWLDANTESDALVGGWDCGTVAGHTSRRLMNLDGLINSWEYKKYLDAGRTQEFITEVQPVDYLVQYYHRDGLEQAAVLFRDVSNLGDWHVAYAGPVLARNGLRSWQWRNLVFLVLTPSGSGPRLSDCIETLTREDPPGSERSAWFSAN